MNNKTNYTRESEPVVCTLGVVVGGSVVLDRCAVGGKIAAL